MSVPQLTHEQRVAASAKAVAIRAKRADVKKQLKSAQLSLRDLLIVSQVDDVVAGMKVVSVLEALPGIGQVKASAIMEKCGIAVSRRLRGLGPHQIESLTKVIEGRSR